MIMWWLSALVDNGGRHRASFSKSSNSAYTEVSSELTMLKLWKDRNDHHCRVMKMVSEEVYQYLAMATSLLRSPGEPKNLTIIFTRHNDRSNDALFGPKPSVSHSFHPSETERRYDSTSLPRWIRMQVALSVYRNGRVV